MKNTHKIKFLDLRKLVGFSEKTHTRKPNFLLVATT